MKQEEIITVDKMNEIQLKAWNALFDTWHKNIFSPELQKLQYRQDCIDCGDIYWIIRFFIDEKGHLTNYKIIHQEIDCANKTKLQNASLKRALLQDFYSWVFPAALKNKIIEAKMGQVRRC